MLTFCYLSSWYGTSKLCSAMVRELILAGAVQSHHLVCKTSTFICFAALVIISFKSTLHALVWIHMLEWWVRNYSHVEEWGRNRGVSSQGCCLRAVAVFATFSSHCFFGLYSGSVIEEFFFFCVSELLILSRPKGNYKEGMFCPRYRQYKQYNMVMSWGQWTG